MPHSLSETPDKDLLFQYLREIEDYPPSGKPLNCNVSPVVKEALREYAESFGSSKFTLSQVANIALIRFAKEMGLT